MRHCLEGAAESKDWNEREALVQRAIQLANATAKLGATIGRLNGGTRQTISVERAAKSTEIAPQNAPNKIAQEDDKPNESLENSLPPRPNPGGGG
jgi:hypothetical protein